MLWVLGCSQALHIMHLRTDVTLPAYSLPLTCCGIIKITYHVHELLFGQFVIKQEKKVLPLAVHQRLQICYASLCSA